MIITQINRSIIIEKSIVEIEEKNPHKNARRKNPPK